MTKPRPSVPLQIAPESRAVGAGACFGGGVMSAGLPGMAHSDSPHPIDRSISR
jgi:hypothetical protein